MRISDWSSDVCSSDLDRLFSTDMRNSTMTCLAGRSALVSGGLRGIGAAVVDRFVAEGASVLVLDLQQASSSAVEDLLSKYEGAVRYCQLDVTQEEGWYEIGRAHV